MEIECIFTGTVYLPKTAYFFTLRVTFWQALFSFLSVFFMAIDTAINDIITRISRRIMRKCEIIGVGIVEMFYPKYGYA